MQIQAGMKVLVFHKVTKLSLSNSCGHDEGSLINNLQIDCERFANSLFAFNNIFYNLLNFCITVALGSYLFNPIFALIICLIAAGGIPMGVIFYFWFGISNKWMKAKDRRMSLWKSIFGTIRFFKIRGWETYAFERLSNYRAKELHYKILTTICFALFIFVVFAVPGVSLYFFLMLYFKAGYVLEIFKIAIFFKLIFQIIDFSVELPGSFQFINDMAIGIKRLNKLFSAEEVDIDTIKNTKPADDASMAVELIDGHFYWRKKPEKTEEEKAELNIKSVKQSVATDNHTILTNDAKKSLNEPLIPVDVNEQTDSKLIDEKDKKTESDSKDDKVDKGRSFELRIDKFEAVKGEVTFLIGKIGSGKSSVLQAIIGEMSVGDSQKTRLHIEGSVCYVGQQPWIINTTIRDNIILDKPLDEEKLAWTIKYSCLDDDLKQFSSGLDTETGEGGDALSGGQRTRIAIARCLYQDVDIYIFDDILSALDSFVGSFIMEQTILQQLKGKTIVMSTHAIQYLNKGDKVYLLDEGKVLLSGKFTDIAECEIYKKFIELSETLHGKKNKEEDIEPEIAKKLSARKNSKKIESETDASENKEELDEATKRIMIPEDRERGNVSWHTVKIFIRLFGGASAFILPLICTISQNVFLFLTYILMSDWAVNFETHSEKKMLQTYLLYNSISALSAAAEILILGVFAYLLSRRVHALMLYSVLHSTLEGFLARVPSGRVMNRFSKDLETIDESLVFYVEFFLFRVASIIVNIIAYGYLIGYEMIVCLVVMTAICTYMQRIYMRAKRELTRLDSIAKSPYLSTFIDACRGLPTLRVMGKTSWATDRFISKLGEMMVNEIGVEGLNQWYNLRATLIANIVVVLPSYLIITFLRSELKLADMIVMVFIGISVASVINETLFAYSNVETCMIAVERCHHFEKIEPEAQYKSYIEDFKIVDGSQSSINELKRRQEKNSETVVTEGKIEFKKMSCKYATSSGPVLNNLTFEIKPKEKIGVIGRTGSGKSTLIKLLWRALDYYEGDVLIDGKSIKQVDLKSLRSQVTIVTQETALIEGSLRENIDIRLNDDSKDPELKSILDRLGFTNQNYIKNGLDMEIDADGSNLSAGEKQLVSFARTVLNKRKIMVLDEATANIDLKTEEYIQKCIEEEFADTTMLIIAHRVQTIMNCDRILVLEQGKMAALDTPANLSKEKDGYFNSIISKMKEQ